MIRSITYSVFDPAWWCSKTGNSGKPIGWVFDNKVKSDTSSWSEICDSFTQPHIIIETKELAPMVAFCEFKSPEDALETKEKKGIVYTAKRGINVHSITAIVLDYENEQVLIEDIVSVYSDYEFVLATSFTHQTEPDHNYRDRFRVILPLKEPIPVEYMRPTAILTPDEMSILPALFDNFPGIDDSSFDIGRAIYWPSCRAEDTHKARTIINHGTLFDWRALKLTPGTKTPPVARPTKPWTGSGKVDFTTLDLYQACLDAGLVIQNRGNWIDIICPWESEHTNTTTVTHSSIRNDGVEWHWCCQHRSHGKHTGDLKQWICDSLYEGKWREMRRYCEQPVYEEEQYFSDRMRKYRK